MTEPSPEESRFPKTRWTQVALAQNGGERTRNAALSSLCEIYWRPIYFYFRSGAVSVHDAEDLTQGFFADLLGRDFLAGVDSEKGKFRCFLLASAKNYLSKHRRRAAARKRGGGNAPLSMDFGKMEPLLANGGEALAPDQAYERQWAVTLLESVLRSLRQHYRDTGRGELFEALSAKALQAERPAAGYAEIAARLGMEEGAAKTAALRMRRRYARLLREAVADTLLDESEVEEELAHLMGLFS